MLRTSGLLAFLVLAIGESVLGSASVREVRCGRRLVSGLFSRPRLPLGYSHVATVPRGACSLNVSELLPSENYIALKVVNGSYIMNGDFALSADGAYEAVGARFLYSRRAGKDFIYARGPILNPIDIMILYQHSSPSIKYEYFTDSLPENVEDDGVGTASNVIPEIISSDVPRHVYRHRDVQPTYAKMAPPFRSQKSGNVPKTGSSYDKETQEVEEVPSRRYVWKIVSFGQCSRSCGGGIQLGKYRCVEENDGVEDREVSPVHCVGSPPHVKRRRCGLVQCPPRWRTAAWSSCPDCGPAQRTRIVGCVQDNSNGITKVSDQRCPLPKPSTSDPCDIPDCEKEVEFKATDSERSLTPREHTDNFREGPVYTVSVNGTDENIGPEYSYNTPGGWLFTEWSECVGWCVGGGIKTRGVLCANPAGCESQETPETSKPCKPNLNCGSTEGHWFTGEWSACSSSCAGRQTRGVVCISGNAWRLPDDSCKPPRPETEKTCGNDCTPTWYFSEWGPCTGSCEDNMGMSRRTVWCARGVGGVVPETLCIAPRPRSQRACVPQNCQKHAVASTRNNAVNAVIPEDDIFIETQRKVRDDVSTTSTREPTTEDDGSKRCSDKLRNCALAMQARLCHYDYYTKNCCYSCKGL